MKDHDQHHGTSDMNTEDPSVRELTGWLLQCKTMTSYLKIRKELQTGIVRKTGITHTA